MATQSIECGTACTVHVELSPAPPTEENIADIVAVAGVLMVFLGTVWCMKQLLNLVTKDEG